MSDMIATGLAWLNGQMKASASVTMTYRRGGLYVDLQVTLGAVKVSPLTTLAGVMADRDTANPSPKHVDHPFWFNSGDLVLNGYIVEPDEGDTMEIVQDGKTKTYMLAAPLDGGRAWRYVDGNESVDAGRICWNGRLKGVS